MDKRKGDERLPSYRNPPVIEVVCGVRFERLARFRAPHSGLLWSKFKREFPTCEHAARVGGLVLENFQPPLPRFWFISADEKHVVQLQDDRFLFNWRKRSPKDEYPRYRSVIRQFKRKWKTFRTFLKEADLGILKIEDCELTYVNHIPKGDGWTSTTDIHKVFPDWCWREDTQRFLPRPLGIGLEERFALPAEKGELVVRLRPGSKETTAMLVLHLSAQGLGPDKSENGIWKWFDLAHRWIVLGFHDLTSSEVQKEVWNRTT